VLLLEMFSSFGIRPPFFHRFLHFPLGTNYDDGNRRVGETVSVRRKH
jgi:hypothetical protein